MEENKSFVAQVGLYEQDKSRDVTLSGHLPSTNRRNPRGFLAKMDRATRVMSASEGSPLGPMSRSASKSR